LFSKISCLKTINTRQEAVVKKNLTSIEIQDDLIKLNTFLEETKQKWDVENPQPKSWFDRNKVYLVKTTTFLISCTDKLINLAQTFAAAGPNKKIAVLAITAQIFDYIVAKAFPIWISPFVPMIKQIVITIIISNLIEFIVSKYKDGSWNMEKKNEPTEPTTI
jgi:hypothetical protein